MPALAVIVTIDGQRRMWPVAERAAGTGGRSMSYASAPRDRGSGGRGKMQARPLPGVKSYLPRAMPNKATRVTPWSLLACGTIHLEPFLIHLEAFCDTILGL
jgi:hypothetical protein